MNKKPSCGFFRSKNKVGITTEKNDSEPSTPNACSTTKDIISYLLAGMASVTQVSVVLAATVNKKNSAFVNSIGIIGAFPLAISFYCTVLKLYRPALHKSDTTPAAKRIDAIRRKVGIFGSIEKAYGGAASFRNYLIFNTSASSTTADVLPYVIMPFAALAQIAVLWSKYLRPSEEGEQTVEEEEKAACCQSTKNWMAYLAGHIFTFCFVLPNALMFVVLLLKTPDIFTQTHEDRISLGVSPELDSLYYLIHAVAVLGSISVQLVIASITSNMFGHKAPSWEKKLVDILRIVLAPFNLIAGAIGGAAGLTFVLRLIGTPLILAAIVGSLFGGIGYGSYMYALFCFQQLRDQAEQIEEVNLSASDEELATNLPHIA